MKEEKKLGLLARIMKKNKTDTIEKKEETQEEKKEVPENVIEEKQEQENITEEKQEEEINTEEKKQKTIREEIADMNEKLSFMSEKDKKKFKDKTAKVPWKVRSQLKKLAIKNKIMCIVLMRTKAIKTTVGEFSENSFVLLPF